MLGPPWCRHVLCATEVNPGMFAFLNTSTSSKLLAQGLKLMKDIQSIATTNVLLW